jgi:hypothetical protein
MPREILIKLNVFFFCTRSMDGVHWHGPFRGHSRIYRSEHERLDAAQNHS